MPDDLFMDLLLKQSATRLRDMRAQVEEKRRLLDFEAEYLDRALAAKGADTAGQQSAVSQASPSQGSKRKSKRTDIVSLMQTDPERVWMPAEICDGLAERGIETTKPGIRVAMKRMVGEELERPGEGAHGFKLKLASTNGDRPSVEAPSLGLGGMGGKAP